MSVENGVGKRRKPCRVRHKYTQRLHAAPREVFPLFCPTRELDWVPGWELDWVISNSGLAERNCVFQTPGKPEENLAPAVWVITRHDPRSLELEMLKFTPGHTVTRLEASMEDDGEGGTLATVTYEHTAIGPRGEEFVAHFTEAHYRRFMRNWEATLNHYLDTGRKAA